MIVREIEKDPDIILKTFDYYNDYSDTRLWCKERGLKDIITKLDEGYESFMNFIKSKYENKSQ